MKTKKMFSLFLWLFLAYAHFSLSSVSAENTNFQNQDEALRAIVEFETTLDNSTPMQLNLQSFKSMFTDKTIPTLALRGRPELAQSKTSSFNKSFVKYIKDIYNEPTYAEILSQNGIHLIEFLELSSEMGLNSETTYVCFRLFYNKIKASELVDDTMLNQILPCFPKHLDRLFYSKDRDAKKINLTFIKQNLESTLLKKITEELPEFESKPDAFTQALANEIITFIKKETDRAEKSLSKFESRERLRQMIIRFLELSLSKLIWNPKAPESVWQSFLLLANNLQLLGVYDIIEQMDDMDDLLWSLVHRFCYFLDLTGSILPLEVYEEIEHDLQTGTVSFLESQEQDFGIKTKKEILATALLKAKTKAYAYHKKGLFTQPF